MIRPIYLRIDLGLQDLHWNEHLRTLSYQNFVRWALRIKKERDIVKGLLLTRAYTTWVNLGHTKTFSNKDNLGSFTKASLNLLWACKNCLKCTAI